MPRHPNDTEDRRRAGNDRRRARIWWEGFLAQWRKLGEMHAVLAMAPNDRERWIAQWSFDLHGRRVMLPNKHLVPYDIRREDGGIFRRGNAKPWERPGVS